MNLEAVLTVASVGFVFLCLASLAILCPTYHKRKMKKINMTGVDEESRPVVHDAHALEA